MSQANFSIVICTRNCSSTISRVFDSIREQTAYNLVLEVILVHHNTTDDTLHIASEYARKYDFPLSLIECNKPGKTPALIMGLSSSSAEFCVIVDDDNFLFSDYVSNASALVKDEDFGCYGAVGHLDPSLLKPSWFANYEGHYAIGMPVQDTDWVWGACALVNLSAWKTLIKLNYNMVLNIERVDNKTPIFVGGEDTEFSLAFTLIGYKVKFSNRLNFIHSFDQSRLQKEYLLSNTRGCYRSVVVTELYRAVKKYKFFPSPILKLYYILFRSIFSNSVRSFFWICVGKKLNSDYHRNIVFGIVSGFKIYRKDLKKIERELMRIKLTNA